MRLTRETAGRISRNLPSFSFEGAVHATETAGRPNAGCAAGHPGRRRGVAVREHLGKRGREVELLDLRVPSPNGLRLSRMVEVVGDAVGDACDPDDDADGLCDPCDPSGDGAPNLPRAAIHHHNRCGAGSGVASPSSIPCSPAP